MTRILRVNMRSLAVTIGELNPGLRHCNEPGFTPKPALVLADFVESDSYGKIQKNVLLMRWEDQDSKVARCAEL